MDTASAEKRLTVDQVRAALRETGAKFSRMSTFVRLPDGSCRGCPLGITAAARSGAEGLNVGEMLAGERARSILGLDRLYAAGIAAAWVIRDESWVRREVRADPTGRYAQGLVDGQRIVRELCVEHSHAGEGR